jgi:hypothetical protein
MTSEMMQTTKLVTNGRKGAGPRNRNDTATNPAPMVVIVRGSKF